MSAAARSGAWRRLEARRNDRAVVLAVVALLVGAAFVIGAGVGNSASGTAPSGTSIPISKGGTSATTVSGALVNLLPDYTDNDGKVLGLTNGTPNWVEQTGGSTTSYMMPDYANIDTTNNLITSNNGTWKADKDGYVRVTTYSSTAGSQEVYINGKLIYINGYVGVANGFATVVPVKVDDEVKISFNGGTVSTIGCYFIPPRYSTPPPTIIVEEGEGGSYSTSEVQTNDKWLDGKPIYKKTFDYVLSGTISAGGSIIMGAASNYADDIELIVKNESVYKTSGVVGYVALRVESSNLKFYNNYPASIGNATYTLTMYYTKTTDD